MKKSWSIQNIYIGLFFAGLILGTLVVNVMFAPKVEINTLWNVDMFDYQQLEILGTREYFVYILLKRIKQFALIFLFFFFINKEIVLGGVITVFSFSIGTLLSLETMRMGLKGIMVSGLYFFPHYLVYVSLFLILIYQVINQSQKSKWMQAFIAVPFLLGGCFLESFVNPACLQIIFDFLVK